MKIGVWFSHWH